MLANLTSTESPVDPSRASASYHTKPLSAQPRNQPMTVQPLGDSLVAAPWPWTTVPIIVGPEDPGNPAKKNAKPA